MGLIHVNARDFEVVGEGVEPALLRSLSVDFQLQASLCWAVVVSDPKPGPNCKLQNRGSILENVMLSIVDSRK